MGVVLAYEKLGAIVNAVLVNFDKCGAPPLVELEPPLTPTPSKRTIALEMRQTIIWIWSAR